MGVRTFVAAVAAVGFLVGACGDNARTAFTETKDAGTREPFMPLMPDAAAAANGGPSVCQKMDILFVIDDSGSMAEEQTGLGISFPKFISVLDSFEVAGGLLDYRIGITSTGRDVRYVVQTPLLSLPLDQKGMNGVLRQDCGMQKRFLSRGDADLTSTFACAAELGTGGPGVEMPLLGAELALGERIADGTNAGFLRDDALLALVFITDEEDCSRRDNDFVEVNDLCEVTSPNVLPPSHFIEFFDTVKKGRDRWAAAAIAGPGICNSSFGSAYEAARLKQFIQLAGPNGVFSSICDGDFAEALSSALSTFKAACEKFPDPE